MPQSTPSPHRFLAPSSRSSQRRKPPSQRPKPPPPSRLRHGISAQSGGDAPVASTPRATPARRFVIAPPQSGANNTRRDSSAATDLQSQVTWRPRPSLQKVESIDESSDSPSPSKDYEQRAANFVDLTDDHMSGEEEEDPDAEMLFTPRNPSKRRRLSYDLSSSPIQVPFERPNAPQASHQGTAPTPGAASHRFLVPSAPRTPAPPSGPVFSPATSTPVPSRRHFILPAPPPSPVKPTTPGPEVFSPSRKGQKFIPGGLAATMQSWVVETASMGYQAQVRDTVVWGRDREDGVRVRIRISGLRSGKTGATADAGDTGVECYPGSLVFATGTMERASQASLLGSRDDEQQTAKVVLAGIGGMQGPSHVTLERGNVVGIRAPSWNVPIGNEQWTMAVDWIVI